MDLDTIKTAVDTGLGGIALLYVRQVANVLKTHETRIRKLEHPKRRRSR